MAPSRLEFSFGYFNRFRHPRTNLHRAQCIIYEMHDWIGVRRSAALHVDNACVRACVRSSVRMPWHAMALARRQRVRPSVSQTFCAIRALTHKLGVRACAWPPCVCMRRRAIGVNCWAICRRRESVQFVRAGWVGEMRFDFRFCRKCVGVLLVQ